jgi:adenylate kinase family enzyme
LRKFRYRRVGANKIVEEVEISDMDIIDMHWDYWSRKMTELYGLVSDEINRENCIRDWCNSHTVIEIKE